MNEQLVVVPTALERHLTELSNLSREQILEGRAKRFRNLGVFEELA